MSLPSALPIAAILGVAVAAYTGLHWLAGIALGATRVGRLLRESLRPTVIAIGLFAVLIVAFAAIASPLRYDASGLYRQGTSRETYIAMAHAALALIYLVAIAFGVASAASASRRERARLAVTTTISVLVFMLLAAPITEGASECYANVTLLFKPSC